MSRTVGAPLSVALSKRIARPIFFIDMAFAATLRYTTGPTLLASVSPDPTFDGFDRVHEQIVVTALSHGARGAASATLDWSTNDATIIALILAEGVVGKAIDIWITEVLASYGPTDVVKMFSGVMDEARMTDGKATIKCLMDRTTYFMPRKFVDIAQGFNHISFPGTYKLGDTVVTVDGSG